MLTHAKVCGKQMASFGLRVIGRVPVMALLICYYGLLLGVSWRRWMSPIADSGRELDLPRRLLEGETLYRDIHYLYPPFAPYFKSLLYRIWGIDLAVLQVSGVVGSLLIVMLIWSVARRILGRREAGLAAAAVILFCVFKPTGNMISPYAYAALYGVAFSLGSLWFALRYVEMERGIDLCLAGGLTGLAAVTKQEFALAAAVSVAAAIVVVARRRGARTMFRDLSLFGVPVALIALPVYGYFLHRLGWKMMIEECHLIYTHLPESMIHYNAHRTGLDRPLLSLLQMAGGGAVLALVAGLILVVADRRILRRADIRIGLILSISTIVVTRIIAGGQWDGSPLRFLPPLLAIVLVYAWRRAALNKEAALLLPIAAYSLAVLGRVALRVPSGGAFGSFFLPTSLIIFVWLLVRVLPEWAERQGMAGWRVRRLAVGALLVVMAATTAIYAVRYHRLYSVEIQTARGHFMAPNSTGPVLRETLDFITTHTLPGDPIIVLPEGSELAFLTGRRYPLRHQIMIPGLMSAEDEAAAIRKIESLRVGYVFVVNRPMREFGSERFGEDFYQSLGGWIDLHYRLVRVFGATDREVRIGDRNFFIKVYALDPTHSAHSAGAKPLSWIISAAGSGVGDEIVNAR